MAAYGIFLHGSRLHVCHERQGEHLGYQGDGTKDDQFLKRVLIVAPHFAPINAPDGHRVRINLAHYARNGWQAEVLCVAPKHRPDWWDDSLLATLPRDIPIHRCDAVPLKWSRLLGVGTLGWRCLAHLALAGSRLIESSHFDLVVFSTTQFNILALGPWWKKRFGIPFVVDLQDPWLNDYYEQPGVPPPPGGWKYRYARWLAAHLEPWCFRQAGGFSLVSEDYRGMLNRRYPWFSTKPCAILPFATPIEDFAVAPAATRSLPPPYLFACVGALNPAFQTALDAFFYLVSRIRAETSTVFPWRFHFTGTSYAGHQNSLTSSLSSAALRHNLQDVVCEETTRVPYLTSLQLMRAADVLLIPGSDDLAYAPSRLNTVCAAGRPVVIVAHASSRLAALAADIPGVTLLIFSSDSHIKQNLETLRSILSHPQSLPSSPVLPETRSASYLARSECLLWDQVLPLKNKTS